MFSAARSASAPAQETLTLLSPRSVQEELAGRIADVNNYHNSVLTDIFLRSMNMLTQNGCAFSRDVQERVWGRIMPVPLSALRTVLIQEIRSKLLVHLGEDELRLMLDEHRTMGQILQTHQNFYANVQSRSEEICLRVRIESQQMVPRIMRTLIDALQEEVINVLLPEDPQQPL